MIYKRFVACLMVICFLSGVITPLSLADQAEEVRTVSEIPTDEDRKADPNEVKESVTIDADKLKTADASEEKQDDPVPEKTAEINTVSVQTSESTAKPFPESNVSEKTEEKMPTSVTDENKTENVSVGVPLPEVSGEPVETPWPETTAAPEITPSPETTESVDAPSIGVPVAPTCMPEETEMPENSTLPEESAETETAPDTMERPEAEKKSEEDEVPKKTEESGKNKPEDIGQEDAEEESDISEIAEALELKAAANCRYAFANSDTVKIHMSFSGGTAPYEVSFTAKGAASEKKIVTLDTEDTCTFKCTPEEFGELKIVVKVTDAEGNTASEKFEIPVPVRIREDSEDWEKDFEDMVLTGDWRADLISVALTQLGYAESNRNFIVEEDGKRLGYTRYGDWYADSSDYYDWCAMFVCFCMHYADIPREDYPRDNISHRWMGYLEKRGAFETAESFEPAGGDLIFFNKDDDSRVDHIGIVEFVDGETVHTIEGNTGKKVARRSYKLDDETIAGYGNTAYLMEKAGVEPEEAEKKIKQNLRQRYDGYTAGTMVNIRAEASAESTWIACIPEKDTRVEVLNVSFSGEQMWYQIRYEDYEGYILGSLLKVDGYTALVYAATYEKSK